MTTPITIPYSTRTVTYEMDGGETELDVPFPVLAAVDVAVYRRRDGVEVKLTLIADYTVNGIGEQDGAVVSLGAAALDGDIYTVDGDRMPARVTNFEQHRTFKSTVINDELNRQAVMIQELKRDYGRALKRSPTSDGPGGAWDMEGIKLENVADGTEPTDAVTKAQLDQAVLDASGIVDSDNIDEGAANLFLTPNERHLLAINGTVEVSTRGQIASVSVPAGINALRTVGFGYVFDGGGALYTRAGGEPSHAGKAQSADGAWWELQDAVLDARMFGVKADGVTDDTSALSAALSTAIALKRALRLPPGVIMCDPDTFVIGNGSAEALSTEAGIEIFGAGKSPFFAAGTTIKARGAGTCMLEVSGVIDSVRLRDFRIDCDGQVAYGVLARSMQESELSRLAIVNWTAYGLYLGIRSPGNSDNTAGWSAGNMFRELFVVSGDCEPYGAGLVLNGSIDQDFDPHRNTFISCVFQLNTTESGYTAGCLLQYCDSNTFIECDFSVYGDGVGYALVLSDDSSGGYPYPQNNFFYGCSTVGGVQVFGDIDDHVFVNHTTKDLEGLPSHAKLRGFTDDGRFFGTWRHVSDLVVRKDLPALVLAAGNGSAWYRVLGNVSDTGDVGFNIEKSADGSSWTSLFSIASNGDCYITVAGALRKISADEPGSGGTGFRRLLVPN